MVSESSLQKRLLESANAAAAGWPQLIQRWSWAELNRYDDIRRLLTWSVAWAGDIGRNRVRVDTVVARRVLNEVDQLTWPVEAEPMRHLIQQCAVLALQLELLQPPPTLDQLDLIGISDSARILLAVRTAERANCLLPRKAISAAHRASLRAAIDWATAIGEGRSRRADAAEQSLLKAITDLHWPGRSAHIARCVTSCLLTAGNPWIWESSSARHAHLIGSMDLKSAVLAGVSEADIGRDYLELRHVDFHLKP